MIVAKAEERLGTRSLLPQGWRWAQLGGVCELSKGRTPREEWYSAAGAWLVRFRDVTPSGVNWVSGFRTFVDTTHEGELKELKPGTVVVTADAHDPKSIGKKICLISSIPSHASPAYYSGELLGIMPKSGSELVPEWVLYWLQSEDGYREIQEYVDGVHLNVGHAKDMKIPLPPTLAEQKRIAGILNERMAIIEKARAATEACMEAANALPRAYLRAVFESDEAKGWPLKRLGDIALKGPDNGIFKHRSDFGEGVPIINVSDLYESLTVTLSLTERVKVTNEELKRYGVTEGDLFFCRSSLKREGVGWCCYLKNLPEPAVFDCHVMRAHLDSSEVMPEYAAYYWQLPKVREMVIGNSRTSTMTTMNQDDLAAIPIPVAPLDEQSCIVAYLNECFDIAARLRKALTVQSETLETLPATLLRRAFTGGL